ncbi:MAG: oligosaccharide flippase family protein [Planctomycetota bacterium]|jgi:O-antigen/teichoic acid export membrane protein
MSVARTILKNTLSNWMGMLINTVILLSLTPYVLGHLGDERYGIYQIVVPVVQYLILLEAGLRGSIVRFASRYIAAKDALSLNTVISTTFCVCLFTGLATMAVCFVLGLLAPDFFNVSEAYRQQVLFLFLAVGFHTAVLFANYVFSGIIIGHNRYELLNLQLIVHNSGKALLVVCFFSTGWASLNSLALAIVLSVLLRLTCTVYTAFWLQDGLNIRPRHVRLATLKDMLGFGSWNMLIQLAVFIVLYANPLIIGRFLEPGAVPYYAIPVMLITRLDGFVRGMTKTLLPVASSALATGDLDLMRRLLTKGTSVASMILFPLGGVLLVMCKGLFRVWLPAGYEGSWVIYAILMIAFFGIISQTAIQLVLLGGGNIRGFAIASFSSSIAAVALSIVLVGYTSLGIIGAAMALAITKSFDNVFNPWYAARQMGLHLCQYVLGSYVRPILCSLPSVGLAVLLVWYFPPANLVIWGLEFLIALIPYVLFLLIGILDCPLRKQIVGRLVGSLGSGV